MSRRLRALPELCAWYLAVLLVGPVIPRRRGEPSGRPRTGAQAGIELAEVALAIAGIVVVGGIAVIAFGNGLGTIFTNLLNKLTTMTQ